MTKNLTSLPSADRVVTSLQKATASRFSPLDLIPRRSLVEKLIELVLSGIPKDFAEMTAPLEDLADALHGVDASELNVVVLGGGSGLSNLVGGDSNRTNWPQSPFAGLKEIFPKTKAIVCITDDGGSTGELLKDFPVIGLGDIRHVLLSSIQKANLVRLYDLTEARAAKVVRCLHSLFTLRFENRPASISELLADSGCELPELPELLVEKLTGLLEFLFEDSRLKRALGRPHCLGNLLVAAAIYKLTPASEDKPEGAAVVEGLKWLSALIGAGEGSVLPCTTTPAHLNLLYGNGVVVTGESKSEGGYRNAAIDRVFVEFSEEPHVPHEVMDAINEADIILFAPGSLYTSIIPILHVPGIAEAVRSNEQALKILVANLWVQKGETDLIWNDMRRRFHVSDMINAYERNIPGGINGLFAQVLLLGLRDIPGSILQSYAVESKMPIFLDRGQVWQLGLMPVEAKLFSESALQRRVVQHDPGALAEAVKVIWSVREHATRADVSNSGSHTAGPSPLVCRERMTPDQRMRRFEELLQVPMVGSVRSALLEIFWRHWDIRHGHLINLRGVELVSESDWDRCQEWDKIHSFFEPQDGIIRIREDVFHDQQKREVAVLVALGQSLLGNYAENKEVQSLKDGDHDVGKIFRLILHEEGQRSCFFSAAELAEYLVLVRMKQAENNPLLYTRLVNGMEGFTPPGMLMGLTYAWYVDNRLAAHIDYKMAITRIPGSSLVPEQLKMLNRRQSMIRFFRKVVFRHNSCRYE
ncbi:MAG: gluconeogenesis factor YvcK family protein [Thermodesulfobacteriota bacterium]